MTDANYTDITILLDRSLSMYSIKDDVVDGTRQFLRSQMGLPGKCKVTLAQFDHEYEVLYEGRDVREIDGVEGYWPRGTTALFDSMMRAIQATGRRLEAMPEHERPGKVLFAIVTDGFENASRKYTRQEVLKAVRHQEETYGWTFVYLAANQDAIAEGALVGIVRHDHCHTFEATACGTQSAFHAFEASTVAYRANGDFAFYNGNRARGTA